MTQSPNSPSSQPLIWVQHGQHLLQIFYKHWTAALRALPPADARWDALIALTGLILLLVSWRHYRAVLMANCAALGWYFGMYLVHWSFVAGVAAALAGIIVGLLAVPLMQASAMIAGGLIGCIGGIALWHGFHQPPDLRWVPAVLGLVAVGIAALYLFRLGLILLCTLEGSILAVGGVLGITLACAHPSQVRRLHGQLLDHPLRMLALLAAVATCSLIYQLIRWKTAEKKEKPVQ